LNVHIRAGFLAQRTSKYAIKGHFVSGLSERVSEQILNGTSAQLGYTVPFTSIYAGKYGEKTNQKQTLQKLSTTHKKQTTQNTAKQN